MKKIVSWWSRTLIQLGFVRRKLRKNELRRQHRQHARSRNFEGLEPRQMLAVDLSLLPHHVIDNQDAAYAEVGGNWQGCYDASAYWGNFRYHTAGDGSAAAAFTFNSLDPLKTYQLFATWTADGNRADNAPFTVFDGSTSLATVRLNQQFAPNEATLDGQLWQSLGVYRADTGTLTARLSSDANNYVIADALCLVEVPAVTTPPSVIDNGAAAYKENGSGWLGYSESGAYQGDFRYHPPGDGSNTANWTFQALDPTKQYQIYVTWSPAGNRATNSPFTVFDGNTSLATVRLNQQFSPSDATIDNRGWQSLGVYTAASGTLTIQLSDDANGFAIADEVRIVEVPAVTTPPSVIDDGAAAYKENGSGWLGYSESGAYQGDFRYHPPSDGSNTAKWTFQALDPTKQYQIYVTWSPAGNRASNSPFTVSDGNTSLATVRLNQQFSPSDATIDNRGWQSLGVYTAASGTLTIQLSDDANGFVIADAVRIVEVPAVTTPPSVIDNGAAAYKENGSGWLSYSESGDFQGDFRYHLPSDGSNTANWTAAALPAGVYQVYATWSPAGNRATNSPFSVLDGNTVLATVRLNQQSAPSDLVVDGQGWASLGQYTINSGSLSVRLSDDANGIVVADGIRLVPVVLYFDPDGNAANNDIVTGAGLGGSGTWTVGGGNCWYDPISGQDVSWVNGAQAVLVGAGGTVTIAGQVSTGQITLGDGFDLESGTILLPAGDGTTIQVASGTANIGSTLTGDGSLTKLGAGTLTLSTAESYAGSTAVQGGSIVLRPTVSTPAVSAEAAAIYTFDEVTGSSVHNGGNLGSSYDTTIFGGGNLVTGHGNGSGLNLPLNSGQLRLDTNLDFSSGTWTESLWYQGLRNDNSWQTAFYSTTDDYQVMAGGGSNNGQLGYYYAGYSPVSDYTLPNDNNWHMVTAVASGGSTTYYVDGASVGTVNVSSTSDLTSIGSRNGIFQFAGVIDDVYVYQQALSASDVQQLYDATSGGGGGTSITSNILPVTTAVFLASNTTLDLNGFSQQVASLSDAVSGSTTGSQVLLGSGTLTVGDDTSTVFSGTISGSGGLVKHGSGTLTLSGENSYTGGTTLAAGTLSLGSSGAIGDSGPISFAGGTLQATVDNTTDYSSRFSTATSQAYSIDTNGQPVTWASPLTSSGGSLTKLGDGVLTLGAAESYTGSTVIQGGTIRLLAGSISTSAAPVGAAAIYTFDDVAGSAVHNGGSLGNSFDATISGDGALVAGHDGGNALYLPLNSGQLRLDTNLDFSSGTWTESLWYQGLRTDNSWQTAYYSSTDDYQIMAGGGSNNRQLGFYHAGYYPVSDYTLPDDNNWHMVTAVASGGSTVYYVDGNFVGSVPVSSSSDLTSIGSRNGIFQFANAIDDVYVYQQALSASDVQQLYSVASGSGGGSSAHLPTGTALSMASNTTLDLNGVNQQIASLNDAVPGGTSGHQVLLGGGTLTIGGNTSSSFSGVISGSGGLTKTGSGVLELSGQNSYEGQTIIGGGVLMLGIDNALPIGTVVQIGDQNSGSGTLDLGGHNQMLAGIYTDAQGQLHATLYDNLTNSGEAGATLTLNNTVDYLYQGRLSGNFSIAKYGAGKWSLDNEAANSADQAAGVQVTVYDGTLYVCGAFLANAQTVPGFGDPQIVRGPDPWYTTVVISPVTNVSSYYSIISDTIGKKTLTKFTQLTWQHAVFEVLKNKKAEVTIDIKSLPYATATYGFDGTITVAGTILSSSIPPEVPSVELIEPHSVDSTKPFEVLQYGAFLIGTVREVGRYVNAMSKHSGKDVFGLDGIDVLETPNQVSLNADTKIITMEDEYKQGGSDEDYDDHYWVLNLVTVAATDAYAREQLLDASENVVANDPNGNGNGAEATDMGEFTISRGEGNTSGDLKVYFRIDTDNLDDGETAAVEDTDYKLFNTSKESNERRYVLIEDGHSSTTIKVVPKNNTDANWDRVVKLTVTGTGKADTESSPGYAESPGASTKVTIFDNNSDIGGFVNRNVDVTSTGEGKNTLGNGTINVDVQGGEVTLSSALKFDAFSPTYHGNDNLQPILSVEMQLPEMPTGVIEVTLTIGGTDTERFQATATFGNFAEVIQGHDTNASIPVRFVIQGPADLAASLRTGHYDWDIAFKVPTSSGTRTRTVRGSTELVNRVDDALGETDFGKRWWIDGLDELVAVDGWAAKPAGHDALGNDKPDDCTRLVDQGLAARPGVALIRGDGSSAWYASTIDTSTKIPVNNGSSGFTTTNDADWKDGDGQVFEYDADSQDSSHGTLVDAGYENDYLTATGGKNQSGVDSPKNVSATWTLTELTAGQLYQVFTTWVASTEAVTAKYTVGEGSSVFGSQASTIVDQHYTPGEAIDGTSWRSLGWFVANGDSLTVTLDATVNPGQYVSADAVMVVGDWTFTTPKGSYDELKYGSIAGASISNGFTLTDKYGTRSLFDVEGHLVQRFDRNSNQTKFDWQEMDFDGRKELSKITVQGGLQWQFAYNGDNVTETDFAGRSLVYSLSDSQVVYKVTFPSSGGDSSVQPVTTFAYDGPANMLGSVNRQGANAGNELTTITYDTLTNRVKTVTNPDGASNTWKLTPFLADGLVTDDQPNALIRKPATQAHIGVNDDASGLKEPRATYTDPRTNVWLYQTDEYGHVTAEAKPATTTDGNALPQDVWRWQRQWGTIGTSTANNLTVTYIQPAGGAMINATGQPVASNYQPTTTYTYVSGNLTNVAYPDGSSESWEYYTDELSAAKDNQLKRHTDQVGRTTRYVRDDNGNVTEANEYATDDLSAPVLRTTSYDIPGGGSGYTQPPSSTNIDQIPGGLPHWLTVAANDSSQKVATKTIYYGEESGDAARQMGLVKHVISAYGTNVSQISNYQYDNYRNLAAVDNGLSNGDMRKSTYTYDKLNQLVQVKGMHPDGPSGTQLAPETDYGYDGVGNRTSVTVQKDGAPEVTQYGFDGMNRQLSVTLPAPGTLGNDSTNSTAITRYSYDANGNLLTVTDPLGATTNYVYDARNQRTTMTQPAPFDGTVTYPTGHATLITIDNNRPQTTYHYDTLGNVKSATDPRSNTTTYVFDELGRLRKTTQPAAKDILNETMHGQPVTENTYFADGRLKEVIVSGPNGTRTTGYQYDGLGRNEEVTLPTVDAGIPYTRYEYDLRDNLRFVYQDGETNGEVYTEKQYDALDRLTMIIAPDPQGGSTRSDSLQTIYQYNPAGELWKTSLQPYRGSDSVTSEARTTVDGYDSLGRLTSITLPNPADGSNTTADHGLVTRYGYDELSNQTSETRIDGTTQYLTTTQYDALSRPWDVVQPPDQKGHSPETVISYDLDGHVISTEQKVTPGDLALGQLAHWRTTTYSFDALGRLYETVQPMGDNGHSPTTYNYYDKCGNLVDLLRDMPGSSTDQVAAAYVYDELNRQIQVTLPAALDQHISPVTQTWYNIAGEVRQVTEKGDPNNHITDRTTSYVTDNLGRVTETDLPQVGGVTPTTKTRYDLLGNVVETTDTQGHMTTYDRDDLGRKLKVTGADNKYTTFKYDVFGELIDQTDATDRVTSFRYDGAGRVTRVAVGLTDTQDSADGTLSTTSPDLVGNWTTSGGITYLPADKTGTATWTISGLTNAHDYELLGSWAADAQNLSDVAIKLYDGGSTTPMSTITLDESHFKTDATLNSAIWQSLAKATTSGTLRIVLEVTTAVPTGKRVVAPTFRTVDTVSVSTKTYDALGDLKTETDRLGHTTTYNYDLLQRQTSVVDANSKITDTAYDLAGRVTLFQDAHIDANSNSNSNTTTFTYDDLDHKTSQQTNALPMLTWQYDTHGNMTVAVDRRGKAQGFTYDELDRPHTEKWYATLENYLASAASPSYTCTTTYDIRSRQVSIVDGNSSLGYAYDELNRLTTETIGNIDTPQVVLTHGYGATDLSDLRKDGLQTSLSVDIGPTGSQTADFQNLYHYDTLDRMDQLRQTGQGGNTVASKFVTFGYDDAGRLNKVARYFGASNPSPTSPGTLVAQSVYSFDPQTKLITSLVHTGVSGATLASYALEYDATGRLSNMLQEWKAGGSVKSQTAAYDYDANGQLLNTTWGGDTTTGLANEGYQYDANGNRTSVTIAGSDPEATIPDTKPYNPPIDNRVTFDGTYTYAYDGDGNRTFRWIASTTGETAPGNGDTDITAYTWDIRGLLVRETTALTNSESQWASTVIATSSEFADHLAANAVGAPTVTAYGDAPNSSWAPITADAGTEFLTLGYAKPVYASGVTVCENFGNGFVTKIEVRNHDTGAFETVWQGTDNSPIDNVANFSVTFAQRGYLVDAVKITIDTSIRGDGQREEIDAVRLTGVATKAADYFYDALNRRIGETVTPGGGTPTIERYVWDGSNPLLDFTGSGTSPRLPARRYLSAGAVDRVLAQEDITGPTTTAVKWLLKDQLGTTRDVVDSAGVSQTHLSFDSYGNLKSGDATVTRWTFGQMQYDAAMGQYYAMARWYDPRTGGFVSEDPLGFGAGDANVNRYCGNSPTNGVDPSGLAMMMPYAGADAFGAYSFSSGTPVYQTWADITSPYWREQQQEEAINQVGGYALKLGSASIFATDNYEAARNEIATAWFFTGGAEDRQWRASRMGAELDAKIEELRQYLVNNPAIADGVLRDYRSWFTHTKEADAQLQSPNDFKHMLRFVARANEYQVEGAIQATFNPAEMAFVMVAAPVVMGTAAFVPSAGRGVAAGVESAVVRTPSIVIGAEARPIISQYVAGVGIDATGGWITDSALAPMATSTLGSSATSASYLAQSFAAASPSIASGFAPSAGLLRDTKSLADFTLADRLNMRLQNQAIVSMLERGEDVAMRTGSMSSQLMGDLTVATGREVALIRIGNQRFLRLGLSADSAYVGDATRLIAHTHPSGVLEFSTGAESDMAVFTDILTRQRSSVLVAPDGTAVRLPISRP